jgi:hypothetical protein
MVVDVDHVAVWRANEEPPYAPRFCSERVDDLEAASFGVLVRLLDAVADVDRDHRVVRSGGVAGDELNDGPAVRGLVSGDPAHVEPLDAEPEVVHVEVASFANVWDGQVRGDAGGLQEWLLLSVAVRAAILLVDPLLDWEVLT